MGRAMQSTGNFPHEKVDMGLSICGKISLPGALNMWKKLIEQVIARACYRAEMPVYGETLV